jgi:hypothetical protein
MSLKKGPPFVREKSSKFRDNVLSTNEEPDVRGFFLFLYLLPAQAFLAATLMRPARACLAMAA